MQADKIQTSLLILNSKLVVGIFSSVKQFLSNFNSINAVLLFFGSGQGLSGPQGEIGPEGPQGNKVGPRWNNLELHHHAHLLRS